jgi:hypothetical protein
MEMRSTHAPQLDRVGDAAGLAGFRRGAREGEEAFAGGEEVAAPRVRGQDLHRDAALRQRRGVVPVQQSATATSNSRRMSA